MRRLNLHYERALRGPVVGGLPGHRRRVDHRPARTGGTQRARPSPGTKPARNAHSKRWKIRHLTLIHRNASQKPMLTPRVAFRFSP
jgi:hypothetical protein